MPPAQNPSSLTVQLLGVAFAGADLVFEIDANGTVIFALGAGKALVRLRAVKLVLKNYEKELNQSFFWQVTLWIFSSVLYFYNGFCAFLSNVIVWRGITYKLESPKKTIILEVSKE